MHIFRWYPHTIELLLMCLGTTLKTRALGSQEDFDVKADASILGSLFMLECI